MAIIVAIVSAIIGFVILPWNLYSSPIVIVYFLGGLGALLGPLFGIVMADYWLIRRQRVDVGDSDDPFGGQEASERGHPVVVVVGGVGCGEFGAQGRGPLAGADHSRLLERDDQAERLRLPGCVEARLVRHGRGTAPRRRRTR